MMGHLFCQVLLMIMPCNVIAVFKLSCKQHASCTSCVHITQLEMSQSFCNCFTSDLLC